MTLPPSERLAAKPHRFTFDAAVRVLMHARRRADPAEAARFRTTTGQAYAGSEVASVDAREPGEAPVLTVSLFGLTGPAGVLPRHYTEAVVAGLRSRSRSLHDFLAVLSQRMTAFFAAAGMKYRPHRAADVAVLRGNPGPGENGPGENSAGEIGATLLALTGYGTPGLTSRLVAGIEPMQHYAGLFASRPRSADRLAALASDWLARPVEVEQFAGAWLQLPPAERTTLAQGLQLGQHSRLSLDATVGVRAWDQQARIVLRVGPLDAASFNAMLPDQPTLRRMVGLVRAFLGFEVGFAINPVLARDALRPLALGGGARLGWDSWVPEPGGAPRPTHAADAVFEADLVEALS